MTRTCLCLVMLIALWGCSFVGGEVPEWTQTLAMQQASFSFKESSVVITASYRNDSNHYVRLNPCGDGELLLLQKLDHGTYRTVYRPVCQAFGRTPTLVAPGDSLSLVLDIVGPASYPEFSGDRGGLYRLVAPDARDERGRAGALQSGLFVIEG